jgi:hypothetical protein
MALGFNSTYKTPKDASFVTVRNQNRMIYANAVLQQKNQTDGCKVTVGLQNGEVAPGGLHPRLLEGARETTAAERDAILASGSCPVLPTAEPSPLPPVPPPETVGSMAFRSDFGLTGSSVLFPNDASLAIGTDDFTIEWFQFWETGASFPRVFSIGSFPSINIAVSYEGVFYLWINNTPYNIGAEPSTDTWVHVAIVGNGTSVKVYVNGSLLGTRNLSYNFTNTTTALAIGNETNQNTGGAFTGQITNFRWVVGTQVYTADFTVPSMPLTDIPGTQLLLLASNETDVVKDSSSANRTPTNTGVTYDTSSPF